MIHLLCLAHLLHRRQESVHRNFSMTLTTLSKGFSSIHIGLEEDVVQAALTHSQTCIWTARQLKVQKAAAVDQAYLMASGINGFRITSLKQNQQTIQYQKTVESNFLSVKYPTTQQEERDWFRSDDYIISI